MQAGQVVNGSPVEAWASHQARVGASSYDAVNLLDKPLFKELVRFVEDEVAHRGEVCPFGDFAQAQRCCDCQVNLQFSKASAFCFDDLFSRTQFSKSLEHIVVCSRGSI